MKPSDMTTTCVKCQKRIVIDDFDDEDGLYYRGDEIVAVAAGGINDLCIACYKELVGRPEKPEEHSV